MNKKFTYIVTLILLLMSGIAQAQEPHVTIGGNVFGGGNKAAVAGSCTVLIDQAGATIDTNVYGGGALAHVNVKETITGTGAEADTTYSHTPGAITTVNILKGTINGAVFGGGLGDSIDNCYGGSSNKAALVYGKVYVNIGDNTGGPTLKGSSVFGCNNINGTPLDSVFVNIYKTSHTTADTYPTGITTMDGLKASFNATNYNECFAIEAVYGGGNKASYKPEMNAASGSNPATPKCTTVHVYGCTENTIKVIYGGGNAADVGTSSEHANTRLIIEGGRYDQIFGGGNGYSASGNHDPNHCSDPDYNPGANITGTASTDIQGGLYRQVFGGSNQYGDVNVVALSIDKICDNLLISEAFGGANEANLQADVETNLGCGDYEIGSFYGGSNKADINGSVTLNVFGGKYTDIFGGSKGVAGNDPADSANITGDVTLNLFAGTIRQAFGGSNINGNIGGKITVNVLDTVRNCQMQLDTVYGSGNLTAYKPDDASILSPEVNILHGTVNKVVFGGGKGSTAVVTANPTVTVGDDDNDHCAIVNGNVFGGGNAAAVTGNTVVTYNDNHALSQVAQLFGGGNAANVSGTTTVDMTLGKVTGGIYGGCNTTGEVGAVTVNLTGGQVGADATHRADVFGGGYGENTTTSSDITVTLNGTTVYGDLYGGSAFGSVNSSATEDTTRVNLNSATLYGSVFGGGKGQVVPSSDSITAVSNGKAIVNINTYDAHLTGLYGGANINGNVKGDITVNVLANVGASGDGNKCDIFGGGFGAATNTEGNVTVNVGDDEGTYIPTIYGDIYGGSALGNVNNEATDLTKVDFLNGTLHGNIFGGGLGDTDNAAKVNGEVIVNISSADQDESDCHIDLTDNVSVYGCNNTNGSPQADVTVNIYKTGFTSGDYSSQSGTLYAIDQVFGGGKNADYLPENGATDSDKVAKVYVHDCVNTIRRVFSGGDAADATGVAAIIDGGRFNYIFGGGNGEFSEANILLGGTNLIVHAGIINSLFGGSNTSGAITGQMRTTIDHASSECPEEIGEFFGGGNLASISTDITTTLDCGVGTFGAVYGGSNAADITGDVTLNIKGGTITDVFGGSKGVAGNNPADSANITGNVTLNLFGGTVRQAFGGSNINGNITGQITVNVLDTVDRCQLQLDTVYGSGNLTAYKPIDNTIPSPEVNILKGTVNDVAFGGGKGTTAVVYANPKVTIGDLTNPDYVAIVNGKVFGGGNAAAVQGGTSVLFQQANSEADTIFGGGNLANVSEATEVNVNGGTVYYDVYGGGALANTGGSDVTLNGGTIRDFYGGGLGQITPAVAALVNGPVQVTVNNGTVTGSVYGCNNLNGAPQSTVQVDIKGGTVAQNVFGGGNQALYSAGSPLVNINGGTVTQNVFGGGNLAGVGAAHHTTTVNIISGSVGSGNEQYGIYGGCNTSGNVTGPVLVNVTGGTLGTSTNRLKGIFGGGYGQDTKTADSVMVVIGDGSNSPVIYGDVYGGSALGWVNNTTNAVNGNDSTIVAVKNGTIYGDVYGGGLGDNTYEAMVYSPVRVSVTGGLVSTYSNGTKGGNIFGCNNAAGAPRSTVRVDINRPDGDTIATNVFGGGNLAAYSGIPVVNYINGTVDTIFGGGNQAGVGGGDVTMKGGTVNWGVYGGCNASGNVIGKIKVNIEGGTIGIADSLNATNPKVANVFGGGYGASTSTSGDVEVNFGVNSGSHNEYPKLYGDIYGGSALGSVNANAAQDTTYVNILDGTLYTKKVLGDHPTPAGQDYYLYYGGNVYGGGLGEVGDSDKGKVNGPIIVNVGDSIPQTESATLYVGYASIGGNVYGCNNTNGSPQDNVTVNIFGTNHISTSSPAYNDYIGGTDFAIDNVFGGGNKASYTASKQATVKIFGCENTIERSFGGGNAAAAPDVLTDIQGGRFKEVYGGGNGELIAANVTGNVDLFIHGGNVGMFFAGSNQQGSISGITTVTVDNDGPCAPIEIDEFFCGGNYANFEGDIDATISCSDGMHVKSLYGGCNQANVVPGGSGTSGSIHLKVYGGEFENVYGGSKGTLSRPANITGDVTLDIYGGDIDTVFGGSNINGNVYGKITVNIFDLEHDPCGLTVHNVYGGGRDAAYTPTTRGNYPEVNIINGWVSKKTPTSGGNVFGGGYGVKATVSSDPKVRIGYDDSMAGLLPALSSLPDGYSLPGSYEAKVDSLVFGGGDLAAVAGTTKVTIQEDNSIVNSLFGGGNNASVGNATVEVLGGTVKAGVYGGCNTSGSVGGEITTLYVNTANNNSVDTVKATPDYPGTIAVDLKGGKVGVEGTTTDVVFGGGYGHSTSTTGNIGVTLGTAANSGSTVYGNLYGGSALGSVNAGTGNTSTVTLTSATLYGSVFGGGMGSGTGEGTKATTLGNATVNVNVHNTNLTGIYGGANINGDVAGAINVNVKADVGSSAANGDLDIFGGGLGAATTTGGDVTVTVGYESTTPTIYGDVYGGSAMGQVNDPNASPANLTKVDFLNGTLHGTIYGGGMGQADGDSAIVNGNARVDVTNGTIYDGVYGGCNAKGGVTGNITVNANGGSIGTGHNARANVHGGGLGNATATSGDVEVNINGATVYGDIYGGSGFGNVNAAGDTTTVNILGGTINGDIYGGGLGRKATTGVTAAEAKVYGKVFVNIGSDETTGNATISTYTVGDNTFGGSVFGCNNANGSPQDSVFVNIYHTAHTTTPNNTYPSQPAGGWTVAALAANSDTQKYAIQAVYGGGNEAAYTPALSGSNPRSATVHVYGCRNNTIKEIYGGGNAANVGVAGNGAKANTFIIIDGGRINRVFGGGKGDKSAHVAANIYGTATTTIKAGLIDTIFGGSNMNGSIDSISLMLAYVETCPGQTDEIFNQVYGGANEAGLTGNLSTTIKCGVKDIGDIYGGSNLANIDGSVTLNIRGGKYNTVFGGSKGAPGDGHGANITGDVELNLNGGTMVNAFGGSNVQGNIGGLITVNVLDTVTGCGLVVDTIYGAGQDAAYNPTSLASGVMSPVVNLKKGTVGEGTVNDITVYGCVFGGGKGETATVNSRPKVVVGDDTYGPIHVLGKVFGGGNLASVEKSTTILMKNSNSTVDTIFGGGNLANVVGSTEVTLNAGTVYDVYGGGALANVGSTDVTLDGASVRTLFGGGMGNETSAALVGGKAEVTVSSGNVSAGVYGGCNINGNVNETEVTLTGGTLGTASSGTPYETGYVPPVLAYVFGGGLGQNTKVLGDVTVEVGDATAGPTIWGDVYGGSAKGLVNCNEAGNDQNDNAKTDVTLNKGTIYGDLYGGGLGQLTPVAYAANVWGPVTVTVTGGMVNTYIDDVEKGGRVFGCNNLNGTPKVSTLVDIQGGTIEVGVFGGGNLADAEIGPHVVFQGGTTYDVYGGGAYASTGTTLVDVLDGTVEGDVYGGCLGGGEDSNGDPYSPAVNGDVTVNIGSSTGGNVTFSDGSSVYGGNKAFGSPTGTATVYIYKTKHTDGTNETVDNTVTGDYYAIGGVYGGGNAAEFEGAGGSYVYVYGCDNTISRVVGGGNQAATKSVHTMIEGGRFKEVFGGGNGLIDEFDPTDNVPADVNGDVSLNIYGGTIGQVFSAGNEVGSISGNITLNINKTTCDMYIGEVYGGGNKAASKAAAITIGCTGTWTSNHTNHNSTTNRIGYELEGIGTVYGGANQADIGTSENPSNITLTITSGIIDTIFGGNNTSGTISGNITVNIDSTGTCGWYVGNVYGGGNQATYGTANSNYPQVNISNGLVSGDVFGGGLGSSGTAGQVTGNPQVVVNGAKARVNGGVYGGGSLAPTAGNPVVTLTNGALTNVYGGGKAANVNGAPTVNINGGTVSSGVYGGCDSQGNVSGDITVNVKSGIIGTQANLNNNILANVFGGGFGLATTTSGNVEVNIDSLPGLDSPVIYGDVYGGSALGNVNNEATDHTVVNVRYGTLKTNQVPNGGFPVYNGGNVFGGGLGRKAEGGQSAAAAKVYGTVTVNIGGPQSRGFFDLNPDDDNNVGNAVIEGNVYGCNNTNGSPQDSVVVNIYRTHREETDQITYVGGSGQPDATYALHNVFGGGNEADYIPADAATNKKLKVWIHDCYNSIERVFGGSNAAAAGATGNNAIVHTLIDGGRFDNVFGGGNGEVSAANINGDVELEIHGGMVNEFFVGSNQQGSITGRSNVVVDQSGHCEEIAITEFYCGGKYADFVGDINATITCSEGMHVTNLYGGCKEAHVLAGNEGSGNIHLVVNGGIFDNVYGGSKGTPTKGADIQGNVVLEIFGGTVTNAIFGGSNVKGAIGGTITVNVEQKSGEDYCPLEVSLADVYGGGNQADYPGVPELNDSGDPIIGSITHSSPYDYPQVNIKNATVKNVFGGGLKANVIGNPQVHIKHGARILGNVYGGGNMGEVDGSPRVIINGKPVN